MSIYKVKASLLPSDYKTAMGYADTAMIDVANLVTTHGSSSSYYYSSTGYTSFPNGISGSYLSQGGNYKMSLPFQVKGTAISALLKGTNPCFHTGVTTLSPTTQGGSRKIEITRDNNYLYIKQANTGVIDAQISTASFPDNKIPLSVIIEIQGAGGGGGGCEGASGGAGGGSGAYGIFLVNLLGTTTIYLGGGGAGAEGSANKNGSSGESSYIKSSKGGYYTLNGGGGGSYGLVGGAGGSAGTFVTNSTGSNGVVAVYSENGATGGASGTGTGGGTGQSWGSKTYTLDGSYLSSSYKSRSFGGTSGGSTGGAAGSGAASAIANGGRGGTSSSVDGANGSNGSGGGGGSFKGVWPVYTAGDGGNGGNAWCRIWY